jgi:concanavalin A-like lectin/glucanase superfamily protein
MRPHANVKRGVLVGGVVLLLVLTLGGVAAAQPPEGLVSWWPGENTAEDIVGGNEGTLQGGTSFVDGIVGRAFAFDGVDDYVSIGASQIAAPLSAWTVDAWFQTTSAGTLPIYSESSSTDPVPLVLLALEGGQVVLNGRSSGGGVVTIRSPEAYNDGCFHHAAFVKRAFNDWELFVDGVSVGTSTTSVAATSDVDLVSIGRFFQPNPNFQLSFFQGVLDEVRVFGRALTAAQIQAIFAAVTAGKCEVTNVAIDITPGSFPNSINPKSKGTVPVAILTTNAFDATTVDPTTVRFGRTGTEAAPVQFALEDVDGDGDTDMILHFNTQDTGIVCGDTSASLTGETFGGQAIAGSDSIKTAGCK